MKAMKAMKKVSARLAKRHVFAGKVGKTAGGLSKADVTQNKRGKIVSKRMSDRGKKSPWIAACNAARKALNTKGFLGIKRGSPLYNKAKALYKKHILQAVRAAAITIPQAVIPQAVITINDPGGAGIVVTLPRDSKVQDLKERIAEALGCPPIMQRLVHGIKILQDGSATLSESGLTDADRITLVRVAPTNVVWSSYGAFFALLQTGKVVAWGDPGGGGRMDPELKAQLEGGIDRVWSNDWSFFVLLQTGKVKIWGDIAYFGGLDPEKIDQIQELGIKQLWTSHAAFFAELNTGKVLAWGSEYAGGRLDQDLKDLIEELGILRVWPSQSAFLILLGSGKVVGWGMGLGPDNRGPGRNGRLDAKVKAQLEECGIKHVWSCGESYFALLCTGEVLAFGDADVGGRLTREVKAQLEEGPGIKDVWSSGGSEDGGAYLCAFHDGTVLAWGTESCGGRLDREVKAQLEEGPGIKGVWSTLGGAFFAELHTGKVLAWGQDDRGGDLPPALKSQIEEERVQHVWSNEGAFLVLTRSGRVACWGAMSAGGVLNWQDQAVLERYGIQHVWTTDLAFFALCHTGKVMCWGNAFFGGSLPEEAQDELEAGLRFD